MNDEWKARAWDLRLPYDWSLRPRQLADGRWKLRAAGETLLRCGHTSMEVTADTLPRAVELMARRARFHQLEEP